MKISFFAIITLHPRGGKKREEGGMLNCVEMRMEWIYKKIRLLPFLLCGILSRILRSHSRGRCTQRGRERERQRETRRWITSRIT